MAVAGGTEGNTRLTALTGALLIVLLLVIAVTLLRMRQLISVHLFVGLLLIGPVVLKLASAGYRFIRYYTHNPVYRRKGPPPPLLRLIAPVVVLTTLIVFVSGVALLFAGPSARGTLLPIHKISFIVWGVFFALHVLGHLFELPEALRGERRNRLPGYEDRYGTGRSGRVLSLAGALVAGLVLAIVLLPQYGPWLHYHHVPGAH